jgi:hypothetical protein
LEECLFEKKFESGRIIVDKVTEPAGDPQKFDFNLSGGPASLDVDFQLDDDDTPFDSGPIGLGNYSVSEDLGSLTNWDLTDANCVSDIEQKADQDPRQGNVTLEDGETLTCTFSNTKRGKIIIEKVEVGKTSPATFFYDTHKEPIADSGVSDSFSILTDTQQDVNIFSGKTVFTDVFPGVFAITETQPNAATWNLIDLVCGIVDGDENPTTGSSQILDIEFNLSSAPVTGNDGSLPDIPANGGRATFDLAPGESVKCVYTDRFGGKIRIIKQTLPDGSSQPFEFDHDYVNGDAANFFLTDADTSTPPVPNNLSVWQPADASTTIYTVAEVTQLSDWDLIDISCALEEGAGTSSILFGTLGQGNFDGSFDAGDNAAQITLGGGDVVACTYTNQQRGTIIVEKQTDPDLAVGDFDFDAFDGLDPATFTLQDNGQQTYVEVVPGTYNVVEQELTEEDFFRLATITCDDGSSLTPSTATVTTRTATFNLDPGETVKCIFLNLSTREGCTPGYWKNHTDRWVGFSPDQTVASVFGRAADAPYTELGDATLLRALNFGGGSDLLGKTQILLRAAVASVLNAQHNTIAFGLLPQEVIDLVNAALDSQDVEQILALASELDALNNAGCPLGGTPASRSNGRGPKSEPTAEETEETTATTEARAARRESEESSTTSPPRW